MTLLLDYAPLLLLGALVTVALAVLSLVLATMMGAAAATAKVRDGRIARGATLLYPTIVRGIPDLVLILLVYFGGQRLINDIGKAPTCRRPSAAPGSPYPAARSRRPRRWGSDAGRACASSPARRSCATPCPATETSGWCW